MPFLINCDNKGCLKTQAALLDTNNNIVICAECQKEIKNITSFAKHQLKHLGQTMRAKKSQKSFAIKCLHCEAEDVTLLQNDNFFCTTCKKELEHLSPPFKMVLKDAIKNNKPI